MESTPHSSKSNHDDASDTLNTSDASNTSNPSTSVSPLRLSHSGRHSSSDSSDFFSPLYVPNMNDNLYTEEETRTRKVSFKTEPTLISPSVSSEEPTGQVPCPHTGCPSHLSIESGRLTDHFQYSHRNLPCRYINRAYDGHFKLQMKRNVHNTSCFCILKVRSEVPFPIPTLLLMVSRFTEMSNDQNCDRILIWVLSDDILTPINVILTLEGETTQCRARTLEDPPDTSNCLYLSKEATDRFYSSNGGDLTLRIL